jgi:predicted dehydrogenase
LEGARAGFAAMLCEKPLCLTIEQARDLSAITVPIAVLHGYRQMWGPQKIRQMLVAGELGEWITVEGRYWQSSAAERAGQPASGSWKNDVALSGPSDVLVDLGSHWLDLMLFFLGPPEGGKVWRSYANAEASHRDTHVHLTLEYGSRRAFGSISKTVHGATNDLEVLVVGSRQSAAWSFLRPDEIVLGTGRSRRILVRDVPHLGSRQAPYHALGWLEGYVEITRQLLYRTVGRPTEPYPDAASSIAAVEILERLH